jgi:hypothetical protein
MYSAEPPMEVHARPITTPGGVVSYILRCHTAIITTTGIRTCTCTCTNTHTHTHGMLRQLANAHLSEVNTRLPT